MRIWVNLFKRCDFSTCVAPRPGGPETVTTPEIIDQIVELILEDLDMRKLCAMWIPKCLNAGQERQRCQSSEQNLECFRGDLNDFLSRLVTINETWLYHSDP